MSQINFSKKEEEILAFWQEKKIFEQTLTQTAPKGEFVFYDGPPFATGLPHYGHIIAGTIKDVIPRYKTMQGYRVARRWGWDCHGLPIENLIEQEKGFKEKKEIEQDIAGFNKACCDSVLRYRDEWKKSVERTGRWVDMENDYKTMDNRYIEVIWWIFKELWKDGLIYEGYKSMHLCPRCETTLSNFEVTLGYKEVKDLGVTVRFRITNYELRITNLEKGANVYLLAWTTTGWTLPGNMALAVGEDIEYALMRILPEAEFGGVNYKEKYVIVAKGTLKDQIKEEGENVYRLTDQWTGEIAAILKGKDLVGLSYEPLFDFACGQIKNDPNFKNAFKVYAGDFVMTAEGTGIVHIAPAFGEDDYQLSLKENLPFLQHVNHDGTFKDFVSFAPGKKVKTKEDPTGADEAVLEYLKDDKAHFTDEMYQHSYPHCWRCDTPLINYAASSWFVKVTALKERLLEANAKINWVPEHIKDGRFGKWLEGARDWAISRSRYWGAPLPVWRCESCKAIKVIGSVAELASKQNKTHEDLHRPYIDEIVFPCVKCGGTMRRTREVFDCWFESGAMPYASELMFSDYKLTAETTKEELRKHIAFPSDFIAEGTDQTRGWFYTLMVLGVALYGESPFKNVIVNGIILAEDGQKMSKRLKNYPDPQVIMDKYGADALRFYLMSSPAVRAEALNFSEKGVDEVYKKVILLTLNVLNFYKLFSHDRKPKEKGIVLHNVLDKWIVSQLLILITDITKDMESYDISRATSKVQQFIDDLSTWYIRRSRDRFKANDENAVTVLGHVLLFLSKIIAPITPFLGEYVYQEIKGPKESVHMEEWTVDDLISHYDVMAEDRSLPIMVEEVTLTMWKIRQIAEIGHSLRSETGHKLRQPLKELQIKELQIRKATLGRRADFYEEFMLILQEELNVHTITLVESLPEEKDGWVVKDPVALYTRIDEDLKEEGLIRELTRQINNLRKKKGLTITDAVNLEYATDSENIIRVIEKYQDTLKNAVIAESLVKKDALEGDAIFIEGEIVKILFSR